MGRSAGPRPDSAVRGRCVRGQVHQLTDTAAPERESTAPRISGKQRSQ